MKNLSMKMRIWILLFIVSIAANIFLGVNEYREFHGGGYSMELLDQLEYAERTERVEPLKEVAIERSDEYWDNKLIEMGERKSNSAKIKNQVFVEYDNGETMVMEISKMLSAEYKIYDLHFLEHTIEEKDGSIDELQARLETIDSIEFYEKDRTKYHGYARAKQPAEKPAELQSCEKPIELRSLPSDASALLGEVNRMIIISEVQNAINEDWLLVKTSARSTFGYVRPSEVELYEKGASYINESEIEISGLKLGVSVAGAIELLGRDYIQYKEHRFGPFDGVFYHGIDIFYEPVSLDIKEIRINNRKPKVEGLFGIGDSIEEAKEYFGDGYDTEVTETYEGVYAFTVWTSDGYRLIFSYKEDIIRSIRYTIYSIDVG